MQGKIKKLGQWGILCVMISMVLLLCEFMAGVGLPGKPMLLEAATLSKNIAPGKGHKIELAFDFTGPRFEKSKDFHRVVGMGLPRSGAPGMPVLPYRTVKVLLPRDEVQYQIRVISARKRVLPGIFRIEPGQRPVPLMSMDDAHKKFPRKIEMTPPDERVYNSREPFPGRPWSEVGVQYFRGVPILIINLYPVQYIPKPGTVFYYENLDVVVTTTPSPSLSRLYRGTPGDIAAVAAVVDTPEVMDTYNIVPLGPEIAAAPLSLLVDPTISCDYVIITSQALKSATGTYTFQTLADHKNSRGIATRIVTVEEILAEPAYEDPNPLFNDTPARIRNFIRDAYLNWGIEYVLLGGDGDGALAGGETNDPIIPPRGFYVDPGAGHDDDFIPADMYYGCLDGTFNQDEDEFWGESTDGPNDGEVDLFAEVYVGRAAVDSPVELSLFVMKTLDYENYPGLYLENACMVGEYLGFGGVSDYGGNYKDQIITGCNADGYTTTGIPDSLYTISTLYDRDTPSWPPSDLISIINNNVHIINHLGHASQDRVMKLTLDKADGLSNNQYFFGYSQGCYAGAFDNREVGKPFKTFPGYLDYDCIVEHLTVSGEGGAFAFIANSRFGWGAPNTTDAPSQRFDREFFDALYGEGIRQIGKANQDSKEDNIGLIDQAFIRWCYYQLNLFGDPEVRIKNPVMPDHDIAVIGLNAPKQIRPGDTAEISAGIMNQGTNDEADIAVDFLVDDVVLESFTIPSIPSLNTVYVNYTWTPEEEGIYVLAIRAGFVPDEDITTNNEQHGSVRVRIPPPVLLVDDDHELDTELWYMDALDHNAYEYDYFEVKDQAGPEPETLMMYDSVIWFTGNDHGVAGYWTLSPTDRVNLGAYLDAGGRLFLCGGKIGYDAKTFGWLDWYNTYLHANLVFVYSEGLQIFNGVSVDPIGDGLTLMIGNPGGDGNPDLEAKASLNQAISPGAASFRSGSYDVAISTDAGASRVVYFGFDFAAVDSQGQGKRDTLMGRVMDWLLESVDNTPPAISGVTLASVSSYSATITWVTDEMSDSEVRYGTTTALGSTASDATMVTEHSLTLTGLAPDTTYYFEVRSTDSAGNTAVDNNGGIYYTFTTQPDTVPPVITDVVISDVTSSSAIVSWTTDEPADGVVHYGTDTSLGSTASDPAMVYDHAILLSGLDPETTYYVEVRSTDAAGNTAVDDNGGAYYTFTTPAVPSTETKTWTGNVIATGQSDSYTFDVLSTSGNIVVDLEWGIPSNDLNLYLVNPSGVTVASTSGNDGTGTEHLEYPATTTGTWTVRVYVYWRIAADQYTLTVTYPVSQQGDTMPPVISGVEVSDITATSAIITWVTDEASDSVVNFDTTPALGMTASDVSMVTTHSVALSGLDPETTYYFEVESTDASGNTAADDNGGAYYTFTTSSSPGGGTETQTWNGTMSYTGQSHNYFIDVTAFGTIILDLTWSPFPLNRLDLYLFDPIGTLVKTTYGSSGSAHLEHVAATTGQWRIMVYANFLLITPENYTLTATYPLASP